MEPRFGADFSQVRVHTGSDAVQMNREVNAQAFAHGQDIYFGAGKAPAKDALTAHELTHVVQQTGEVHMMSGYQRGERDGHKANLSVGQIMQKSPAVQQSPSNDISHIPDTQTQIEGIVSQPGAVYLQLYQAGDTGHGGIEKEALTDVGFTDEQASQVYFGNWLRDLSQLPPRLLPLLQILGLGEFNRPVTNQDLGTYIPSEHLDNPLGGKTIEDRPDAPDGAPAAMIDKDTADKACCEHKLSNAQCDAFKDEENHRDDILKASKINRLPYYIRPVGK
jgi:hypothetical protein